MTRIVLGVVAALAVAAAAEAKDAANDAGAAGSRQTGELAAELQSTMRAFEDAWNRHDPKALAAAFANDGVLINPSGRIARGRAEIEGLFEDQHRAGPLAGTQLSQRLTGIRQVAPGVAFIDLEITIRGQHDAAGAELPDQRLHGAMLVARRSERWQIVEGRPYQLVPAGPPGGAASAAVRRPQAGGTGSGATPSPAPEVDAGVDDRPAPILDVEDTAHNGP